MEFLINIKITSHFHIINFLGEQAAKDLPLLLVGNKCDLEGHQVKLI